MDHRKNNFSGSDDGNSVGNRDNLSYMSKNKGNDILNGFNHNRIKDVICFSHLRWNFVFQRPQHLLSRWAKESRVFYFEEPIFGKFESNFLKTFYSSTGESLVIITPHVQENMSENDVKRYLEESVNNIINWYDIKDYLSWYLTPMAVAFTYGLHPEIIVYDSMDELSSFKGAHPEMLKNEQVLFSMADVVFTGGQNLYEYKKHRHHNMHPFPSSIDQKHFESGLGKPEPSDQIDIPGPRVGFFGVIDERLDIFLLENLAKMMPDVHYIMIGPVVKIDPSQLPSLPNIHYLGQKSYNELPLYLAHWDVAIMPFARNESTRFISPTKTPEYLSALRPVVSTSIRDVIVPYGELGLVEIADDPEDFAKAITKLLNRKDTAEWEWKTREHLRGNSWDLTWMKMKEVIFSTLEKKQALLEVAVNRE